MDDHEQVRLDDERISSEVEKLLNFLNSQVIGQSHAIRQLADGFELFFSGKKKAGKPITTLMFIGPSGCGKTLTAHKTAEYFFGDPNALLFINCTELDQEHHTAKLVGAPPGYIGFIEGNDLTSPYPLLTNWNIYKHHLDFLRRKYKAEDEELGALEVERYKIGQQRAALFKRFHELRDFIKNFPEKQRLVKDEIDILSGDSGLPNNPKRAHRLQEKNRELRKLEDSGEIYGKESRNLIVALNEMAGKIKEINEKIEKLRAVFGDGALDWDGAGQAPKSLFGIILFDEIEKAHEKVRNLMFRLLAEGRLTLSNGQEVNVENCLIIVTGNLASDEIGELLTNTKIGFDQGKRLSKDEMSRQIYDLAMEAVNKAFPPSFVGRFDSKEVFRPLYRDDMAAIFDLELAKLLADLKDSGLDLQLEVGVEVKEHLVDLSMKRMEEGARLLNQRLRKYVHLRLVRLNNTEQIASGSTVIIGLDKGERDKLTFSVRSAPDV